MDQTETTLPTYVALHFLARYGNLFALILAFIPLLAGIWAWMSGMHFALVIVGLATGALIYLIMRSYVELVRVIIDTLLPK